MFTPLLYHDDCERRALHHTRFKMSVLPRSADRRQLPFDPPPSLPALYGNSGTAYGTTPRCGTATELSGESVSGTKERKKWIRDRVPRGASPASLIHDDIFASPDVSVHSRFRSPFCSALATVKGKKSPPRAAVTWPAAQGGVA